MAKTRLKRNNNKKFLVGIVSVFVVAIVGVAALQSSGALSINDFLRSRGFTISKPSVNRPGGFGGSNSGSSASCSSSSGGNRVVHTSSTGTVTCTSNSSPGTPGSSNVNSTIQQGRPGSSGTSVCTVNNVRVPC